MTDIPDDIREKAASGIINRLDPVYIFLNRIVFKELFRPKKANYSKNGEEQQYEILEPSETEFLIENLNKHRIILWLNLCCVFYLYLYGIDVISNSGNYGVVVTGLLAPAMITGGAWYTVTFGGIPEKFISIAFVLTFCMFTAFSLSMTLLIALLASITPWPVTVFILVPVYSGLYVSSMLYDNVDGLKIGLDSTLLRMSRAAINYYQKHGLLTKTETYKEEYNSDDLEVSEHIASFNNYIELLERGLEKLGTGISSDVYVANQIIASSIDLIYRIMNLPLGDSLDVGDEKEFSGFIYRANRMEQPDVDRLAIRYLKVALDNLPLILKNSLTAVKDIGKTKLVLEQFEKIQKNQLEGKQDSNVTTEELSQELADYLFAEVFEQLLSLMKAHRQAFFQSS